MDNLRYEPRSIIRAIEQRFQYTINYAKAWRAKQKAIEMRFGTYEDSYHNIPRQLATICGRNPCSYYDIKHYLFTDVEYSGKRVLQCVFFAFGATIKTFRYCRPIICLDGTFLTRKYKGRILSAIGVDGNNQVLALGFAFVKSENGDSWYWFLERVKHAIVVD